MQKLPVGILPLLAGLMTVFWLAAAVQAQPPATVFPTRPPPTTSGGSGMALLNLQNTVALHGYDPISYFTRKQPVPGNKRINERLGGATYYFASRANRYTFLENAPQYQPQMGGYCVTSMSRGRLEDINPEKFLIYEGKLYMFRDDEAMAAFLNDPHRVIYEAREHYFRLAQRQREHY